ncbi:hypothetical protein ACHQM5_019452 [Ranunculus cassubicifolius]
MAKNSVKSKAYLVFLNISFVLLFGLFFKVHFFSSEPKFVLATHHNTLSLTTQQGCKEFQKLGDYEEKCSYLRTNHSCDTSGYIDYMYVFYCMLGNLPYLGFFLMLIWLLVLFYLLGDTASVYFCSALESLAKLLKLSPAIAGVTLLSLGNGAPDLFSSIVSFTGTGSKSVGVNSVLGGAFFVSCVVVGMISILVGPCQISVKKYDFVRDVCFLILGLLALLMIVMIGKIDLWGALAFASLYIVYVVLVWKTQILVEESDIEDGAVNLKYIDELEVPILHSFKSDEFHSTEKEAPIADGDCRVDSQCSSSKPSIIFSWFIYCIDLPLSVPRRLTIPVIFEDNWSKPYAVASVTLAPMLLAVLCYTVMSNMGVYGKLAIYGIVAVAGVVFGVLAFLKTETSSPPQKFLYPWLIAGFVMSMTWSYIIANELVALLVSIGYILGISPSILGLTVLAWGNSLGDLITNIAMSMKGGREGTQVAISGSYAGPIFNLLVGLGLSQIIATWSVYPASVTVGKDKYLLETLAFLVIGLLWALVILPWRKMKLDRYLGTGLLVIYIGCISLRIVQTLQSV